MIRIRPLKRRRRKEVKEDPNSVAYGRFQCLVTLGRKKRSMFFTSSHFPPNKFTQTFFFSIDIKVLLYHGSRLLFTPFLGYPWPINYNHAFWCNKSPAHSLPIWLKIFFLSLNSWHRLWPHLTGLKSHKWTRNHLENHP
jgi:hypothetical protein